MIWHVIRNYGLNFFLPHLVAIPWCRPQSSSFLTWHGKSDDCHSSKHVWKSCVLNATSVAYISLTMMMSWCLFLLIIILRFGNRKELHGVRSEDSSYAVSDQVFLHSPSKASGSTVVMARPIPSAQFLGTFHAVHLPIAITEHLCTNFDSCFVSAGWTLDAQFVSVSRNMTGSWHCDFENHSNVWVWLTVSSREAGCNIL